MYTGIFPFKRDGTYWAAINSPVHIQRVLAFGNFDNLKHFLKSGVFENGTTVDLRPYNLIGLDHGDAIFAGKKHSLFGFVEKGQQQTSLPDYPSGLLDNFRGGEPLSEEELRQCSFYMGFDKAQAVANGLEARLQHKFSDKEKQTIIAALGSIPIKNGLKNGNGHEKHNGVYLALPNIALNDLVNIYLRSLAGLSNGVPSDLINVYLSNLAENGPKPNGSPYSMTSLVEEDTNPDNKSPHEKARDYLLASERFNRIVIGALLINGATQMPKRGIMYENTLTQHSTTSNSYHSLPIALAAPLVYSAILRVLNLSRGDGFDEEDAGLDELDLPQPDKINVPVKHANGLDAIARMAKKFTGHIGTGFSPRPFG